MSRNRVGVGKGPECVSSDHGERQVEISQHIFLNRKGRKTSIGMAWQQMVSGISLENLWDRKKSGRDACNKGDTDSHLLECLYFLTSKASSKGSWELKSCLTSPSEPAPINASQRAPE